MNSCHAFRKFYFCHMATQNSYSIPFVLEFGCGASSLRPSCCSVLAWTCTKGSEGFLLWFRFDEVDLVVPDAVRKGK